MKTIPFLFLLAAAVAVPVRAQTLPPATPLIEDGPVSVTAADFEGYVSSRIPEKDRVPFRTNYERVAGAVDALFVARAVAKRAADAGLDKSPEVQARLQQLRDGVLADLYLAKADSEVALPNLEQRAREIYRVNQKQYTKPEQVALQHIVIDFNKRTVEMSRERAKEIYAKALAGTSADAFKALVREFSDDPNARRNSGELIENPAAFEPAFAARLAKMTKLGEISEPIETRHGFHIIRFIGRKPAEDLPFAAVRADIIAAERQKFYSERRQKLVEEIRSSSTVIVHRNNVEALQVKTDMKPAAPASPVAPGAAKKQP